MFERAPVGIALLDTDLRFVRVNDHITEINGVPAADHVGRTIADVLPGLPPEVEADAAEVARTGQRVSQVEVVGSTPAQPGVTRHWIVSYWPVRTPLTDELVGVGIVVDEVTERRAAERALRAQTDRYEALLLALSEAGEGLVVLERDGRCVYANAAFEQLSGYTFPELAAMDSVLDLVVDDEREDVRRRAAARIEQGAVEPALALTLRRRDGATRRPRGRRRAARRRGPPPARRRRPRRLRAPARRGRARGAAAALGAASPRPARCSTSRSTSS